MSNVVNRVLTEQLGGRHAETFIGKPGELFYDAQSGALKVGDGVTPGGQSITESSPLESLFIGPWVHFNRPDDSPEVQDHIADNLILARANGGSLYNAYDQEDGYELNTPSGTQWNTQGWHDLSNTTSRYYDNLTNSWSGGGWAITKHDWILHDTNNDKYYAIRFLSWDSGNNNAFSYIRRQINTAIYFNREDTNDQNVAFNNCDQVDSGLAIARGNGQAIFNYAFEPQVQWTQFTGNFDSATYDNVTKTITFVNPSGSTLEALLYAGQGPGEQIYMESSGNGSLSVNISGPYDPETGILPVDYDTGWTDTLTGFYLNWPTTGPKESNYDEDQSPKGTLWNAEGYDDLSNLKSRQWMVFDDLWAGNYLGKRITGKELVMWDTINDKYYAIKFTRWQQGNNYSYPGFAYTRRLIDVNKLTAGLKFSDGTIQHTAYSDKISGTIKHAPQNTAQLDNGDRYITPGDIGKTIYLNSQTSTNTLRIGDGGTADFPIGATITIINRTGGTVYLYKDNNDEQGTIYGAGTSNYGTGWQIPDNGGGNIATLMKIETGMDNFFNDWMLSGSNISLD
jgi:hypothetical protein